MKLASSKITLRIVAATIVLYATAVVSTGFKHVTLLTPTLLLKFGANFAPFTILHDQFWRVLTAGFIHRGPIHMSMNIWALCVLGPMLEELVGARRYLLVYLLSIIGGSIASILYNSTVISCGASGGTFGMLGCYASYSWLSRKLSKVNDGRPVGWVVLAIAIYCIILGALNPMTDNANHIGGLLIGTLLGIWCAISDSHLSAKKQLSATCLGLCITLLVGIFAYEKTTLTSSARLASLGEEQQAIELAADHRFAEALEYINRAVERQPLDNDLLTTRVSILIELKRYLDALTDCNTAIARNGGNETIYLSRSVANHRLGNDKEAVADLTQLIKLSPDKALAYNNRAWSLTALKEYTSALADADKALSIDKTLPTAWDTKAVILSELGRYEEALKCVNNALTFKKDDGAFYYHRALILTALGKGNDAGADQAKASELGYQPETWESKLSPIPKDASEAPYVRGVNSDYKSPSTVNIFTDKNIRKLDRTTSAWTKPINPGTFTLQPGDGRLFQL